MGRMGLELFHRTLSRRYGGYPGNDPGAVAEMAAPGEADVPSPALACWLGRQSVLLTAARHPELFAAHGDAPGFLRDLAGAVETIPSPAGGLLLSLRPAGGPCAFVAGVAAGVGEHYGESLEVNSLKCVRRGDNRCVLAVFPRRTDSLASHGRWGREAPGPDRLSRTA